MFFIIQILCVQLRRQMRPTDSLRDFRMFQLSLLGFLVAGLAILVDILASSDGILCPLSSRVREVFLVVILTLETHWWIV
jgi:hypothetical protein